MPITTEVTTSARKGKAIAAAGSVVPCSAQTSAMAAALWTSADGASWSEQIGILAARPRTYVKLSGLAPESTDATAFDAHADAFIRRGVEAFGPDRAMIGSDWPVSANFGVGGTFAAWATRVRRVVGEPDWPAVSGEAARAAYLPGGASALR